jgi:enoyl-CoA hydratase/carnithine racemase
MCDIRIASDRASFGEIFVKLGLIPGDGGCWFLQRAVGYAKAAEMVLTGEAIGAEEALACGLVTKVTTPETLMEEARKLARRIAANPADAVRMAKALMRESRDSSMRNALEMAAAYQAITHHSEDHEAFLARLAKKQT